jgi:hypothetical protein
MWVNNISLFWFTACLFIYPFWLLYILITKRKGIGTNEVENFGGAFDDVLKDNKNSVYPIFLNLVRRLILVFLMIFMTDYPVILIFSFMGL